MEIEIPRYQTRCTSSRSHDVVWLPALARCSFPACNCHLPPATSTRNHLPTTRIFSSHWTIPALALFLVPPVLKSFEDQSSFQLDNSLHTPVHDSLAPCRLALVAKPTPRAVGRPRAFLIVSPLRSVSLRLLLQVIESSHPFPTAVGTDQLTEIPHHQTARTNLPHVSQTSTMTD